MQNSSAFHVCPEIFNVNPRKVIEMVFSSIYSELVMLEYVQVCLSGRQSALCIVFFHKTTNYLFYFQFLFRRK